MAIAVGAKAPDFKLLDIDKKERTLSEFLGKKLVLAFFPGAFTGVCTKEMCQLRDMMSAFNGMNAQVVGITVDSPFANKAFAAANNLSYPILSDFTRATIRAYGISLDNFAGISGYSSSQRSVFIIDKAGIVRYAVVTENPGVEPPYADIEKALAAVN